jgi:amino-acid N-acetyltransferase
MNAQVPGVDVTAFTMGSAGDLDAVAQLLAAEGLPHQDIAEHIRHFVLARDHGYLIGTAGVQLCGRDGLLRSVCVSAGHRNRGLGRNLCRQVVAYSKNAGLTRLFLLTTSAAGFFERMGFSACSREVVPSGVLHTAEFTSLCPATAVCMVMRL